MTVVAQIAPEKKVVKIGDYALTGKIGQGGIAEIYRARQESLDRDVAIKILSSKLTNDPDIVKRFERESLVIARLNHPNIVHVIDRGNTGGRYYFVMDFIDGTSLREIIDSQQIDLRTKLEMIVQVCKALDYAHKNGVIHRDIKPTNVLVDKEGNALVADFGIAQIIGAADTEVTSSDVILGTLAYMSPEQKVSSTNVDQTTDIYAVGVMLYEILVGKKPLGRFKLPTQINPKLDSRFDEIINRCLSQDPFDRFQSAVELKDAIVDVTGDQSGKRIQNKMPESADDSFLGKCRYLDTIKETKYSTTVLVENRMTKRLFVIKKHQRGEVGRKEAKLFSSLRHKHIIHIYGCGGDQKNTVIISQYAQGGSLADRLARRHDWETAFKIALQIAAGLDFAHKNNIVHGNLRPSNVLFDNEDCVKLSDFGMPSHYDLEKKENWYRAPERKKSKQADIYALGVILYQLLTGRTPIYDDSSKLHLGDMRRMLPEEVGRMLDGLLAFRVVHRYKSCSEFIAAWDAFDQRRCHDSAPAPSSKAVTEPTKSSIPLWAWLVMGGMLVAGIFLGLYFGGVFG